ncbi:GspH/FimT family pseudopilin [Lysobacter solisilvae (ex Woo and Kim 2022)]|uniref:Type II secretion system protein H n=1 Tax=Agrilutibacter terrestris TaxID=2865112 RepID=A0A7H0FY42_9GAMM|nr:GspH/FimT family pseudopilin [Lysobacter terrestris]QNP40958.1 GspH/FimT family pseudopilin [Lysobacter terrestris]
MHGDNRGAQVGQAITLAMAARRCSLPRRSVAIAANDTNGAGATVRPAAFSATGMPRRLPPQGFTLVELMVAMAVLAILAVAAMPALQGVVNGNRLRAAANETIATLQSARIAAVRFNRRAVACMSADPNAAVPSCQAVDASGWIVFLDANRDGQYAASERLIRRASVTGSVQLLGSAALNSRVTFNADGMARDAGGSLLNAAVGVCLPTTQPQDNESTVSISAGSRIRVSRKNAAGKCITPGDVP